MEVITELSGFIGGPWNCALVITQSAEHRKIPDDPTCADLVELPLFYRRITARSRRHAASLSGKSRDRSTSARHPRSPRADRPAEVRPGGRMAGLAYQST